MKVLYSRLSYLYLWAIVSALLGACCVAGASAERMLKPDDSPYKSIDDLPDNLRSRVDAAYSARQRMLTPLDGRLEKFSVDRVTVPDAVARLSNEHSVLCGIELVPWQTDQKAIKGFTLPLISLSVRNTTPRQVLDKLISLDPNFVWNEDQGVANIVLKSAYNNPAYPLNLRVDKFSVTDRPYPMVFLPALLDVTGLFQLPQVSPALPIGSIGRWPAKFAPKVSFELQDVTVRAVVNRVARDVKIPWRLVWYDNPLGQDKSSARFEMEPQMNALLPPSWTGSSDDRWR
ncbi:MAG: hypothetical protein Q7T82_15680 [Armatimonadota bacterium]|nr:hypothetical protein [Armatimonadota bacterium]